MTKPDIAAAPVSRARAIGLATVVLAGPSLIGIVPLAVVPALPALTLEFAGDAHNLLIGQIVLALPAVMILVGAPAAALAVERWGLRTSLVALLLLYAVAGAAGFGLGFAGLVVARLLLGLAAGAVAAISTSLVGAYFSGAARENLLGYMAAAPGLFAVAVLSTSGWIVDTLGWRAAFGLYLLSVPVALLAMRVVGKRLPAKPATAGNAGGVLVLWPLYALLVFLSVGMFMMSLHGAFLLGDLGVSTATASGLLLSLPLMAVVVMGLSYGRVRQHASGRWMLVAPALLLGAGNALAGAASSLWMFAIGEVIFGLGCGLVYPVLSSIILRRVPAASQTRAAGLITSAVFLGQLSNPFLVAPLRPAAGVGGSFVLVGGTMLIAALALALFGRRLDPESEMLGRP